MRVALLADIHGNLRALNAVLEQLEQESIDRMVCLGDVAVGPQPTETLERVRSLDCPILMGNWDAWFLDGFPELAGDLGRKLVEIGSWWADLLSPEDLGYMRTFERVVTLDLGGDATVTAFHGSPRSLEEGILSTTPDEEVEQMLAGVEAPLVVCGHTHFQLLRRVGDAVVINPGSVGLPFRRDGGVMQIAPWAEYGILTADRDRLCVDLRRTTFDVQAHTAAMVASGMPHAQWWTALWSGREAEAILPTV